MARDRSELDEFQSETDDYCGEKNSINRRSYLKLAGATATVLGASAGVSSVSAAESTTQLILDYDDYSSPSDLYNVNDNRSGIAPEFVSSPTKVNDQALRTEFSSAQKTANLEYRFEEHGHGMPREVYTRFYLYPENIELDQYDTVRIFWLPLTNGSGSSGGGGTDGTNGWSNAIGFAHRNDSPAPDGYNLFSYSYHMDRSGSGDFEMTSTPVWMDEWNLIEGYVRCNTFSGGSANADGVMRYWVNGELAYERTDFRFTTSEDNLIEGVGPLGYVVGSDLSGSALIYDGHKITIGGMPDETSSTDEPTDPISPYEDDPYFEDPANSDQYEHQFTYRDPSQTSTYRIYVDGEIVQSDWSQATYNDTVSVTPADESESGYTMLEAVGEPNSVDGYFLNGNIVALYSEHEPGSMWLSGEQVYLSDYPSEPPTNDDTPLENMLLIDGIGSSGSSRYEFRVSGRVEKSNYRAASINDDDVIDDGHVTGTVGGWRDAYKFSGELQDITVDGDADVSLNGEEIDTSDDDDELSTLTIVGNGNEVSYEATVDGSIEIVSGDGAESLSDSSVRGTIERDVHRFRFSGNLVEFTFMEGKTQVYVGRDRIHPADYS
ncbi:hypothetical protein [Natronorubrum thiooxidans]|uniref:Uncharacterized protein n=1 Tax=Natronorubrum thiooxidans TaxID=308853 RepID=A0A1N7FS29_9EURY|nr:hypothetical protein [Natronorubrum thiooxidans]SIS03066.1 hypothetical protein SAMN05421752_10821 [Natronorubrum thiooxidans]